jgi:hypothetical protein
MNSTRSITRLSWLSTGAVNCFIALLCVLGSALPVTAQTPDCPQLTQTFAYGSHDNQKGEMRALQQFLFQYVSSTTQLVTGYFGIITKANLKQFQTTHGLPVSGTTDAATRAGIAAVCTQSSAPTPVAAFDLSPITSLQSNATITGTAKNLIQPLHITIEDKNEVSVYASDLTTKQSQWQVTVFPPISSGSYIVNLFSGSLFLASTTLTIGLRSFPIIEVDNSLPVSDVVDGRLMRFKVTARGVNPVSIAQMGFAIVSTGTSVSSVTLSEYTDTAYSQPLSTTTGAVLNSTPADPTRPFVIVPDSIIEVPAGNTYYFELDGMVSPTDTNYTVETTLLGDAPQSHVTLFDALASTSNFVWSPNTYGLSSTTDSDWTTSSLIVGVPQSGLTAVRTSPPPTDAASCNISASTSTAKVGTPVTLTWTSRGATKAVWDDGSSETVSGTKTYTLGSMTRTYILNVSGPYGQSNCFATVAIPSISTTTQTTPTTTPDSFTATPTIGNVSFAVTFAGSVNNAKTCNAQTYTLGYGDGASTTISVPTNLCKAQSFNIVHTYSKVGTSTAGLYKGTGTSTAQRIQIQAISAKAKGALLFDAASNIANIFSAVTGQWHRWLRDILEL